MDRQLSICWAHHSVMLFFSFCCFSTLLLTGFLSLASLIHIMWSPPLPTHFSRRDPHPECNAHVRTDRPTHTHNDLCNHMWFGMSDSWGLSLLRSDVTCGVGCVTAAQIAGARRAFQPHQHQQNPTCIHMAEHSQWAQITCSCTQMWVHMLGLGTVPPEKISGISKAKCWILQVRNTRLNVMP